MKKNDTSPTPATETNRTPQTTQSSGLAIASLILGILSLTGFGLILGIPAIITGVMALKRSTNDRGLSWTGIITGIISTVISLLILLLFVVLVLVAAFSAGSVDDYYQELPDEITPTESA